MITDTIHRKKAVFSKNEEKAQKRDKMGFFSS